MVMTCVQPPLGGGGGGGETFLLHLTVVRAINERVQAPSFVVGLLSFYASTQELPPIFDPDHHAARARHIIISCLIKMACMVFRTYN